MPRKPLRALLRRLVRRFSWQPIVRGSPNREEHGASAIRTEEAELQPWDRDALVAKCMLLRRQNPIVASLSRQRKSDVVGKGLVPHPSTGDLELDGHLRKRWDTLSRNPEVTGQMDMRELQQQIADTPICEGDCALVYTDTGRFQFVPGSLVGSPTMSHTEANSRFQHGREIDSTGRVIQNWIGRREYGVLKDLKPVPEHNCVFHFKRMRASQYRGIPEIATVVNLLQDVDEWDRLEMIAAKVAASYSIKFESDGDDGLPGLSGKTQGENRLQDMVSGQVLSYSPGERAEMLSPNGRPNIQGAEWGIYILRKVGAALGYPIEFTLMLIGEASFSAAQGVVLQYQQTIESEQNQLERTLDRARRRWIAEMLFTGELDGFDLANLDPFACRWQRPSFRWINRQAQVNADMAYYGAGAITLSQISSTFGNTPRDAFEGKLAEIALAQELAQKSSVPGLSWRDLISTGHERASVANDEDD